MYLFEYKKTAKYYINYMLLFFLFFSKNKGMFKKKQLVFYKKEFAFIESMLRIEKNNIFLKYLHFCTRLGNYLQNRVTYAKYFLKKKILLLTHLKKKKALTEKNLAVKKQPTYLNNKIKIASVRLPSVLYSTPIKVPNRILFFINYFLLARRLVVSPELFIAITKNTKYNSTCL